MFDVVAYWMTPVQIRDGVVVMNALSAIMVGFMAFAVTPGAGIKCYFAFLRFVHRVVLVLFSIALAYNAADMLVSNHFPAGPAFLLMFGVFFSSLVSALRHVAAPSIPENMTWRGFFKGERLNHRS